MIKILAITPNPQDGTSWYRSGLPLSRLQQTDDVQVIEYATNAVEWNDIVHFDVLFMQRPHSYGHVRLMNKAIFMGVKVWVDWDDLLWDVPRTNPCSHIYNNEECRGSVEAIIRSSATGLVAISVSTMGLLKEVLAVDSGANVWYVPNALDERLLMLDDIDIDDVRQERLGWRGSDTHQFDVAEYKDQLLDINLEYPVEYIGMRPWSDIGEYIHTRPAGLLEYYALLKERRWRAFFVCLEDNRFNRSKSNIAYLEAFFAGAITIAPAWEGWICPGVLTYKNKEEFSMRVEESMHLSAEVRKSLWRAARDYIKRNHVLSVTNKVRMEMLNLLINSNL